MFNNRQGDFLKDINCHIMKLNSDLKHFQNDASLSTDQFLCNSQAYLLLALLNFEIKDTDQGFLFLMGALHILNNFIMSELKMLTCIEGILRSVAIIST